LTFSVLGLAAFITQLAGTPGRVNAQQAFPQPDAAHEVVVREIAGVIAAGSKWSLAWGGPDNADGIVGTADGGLLFAQEQPSRISKLTVGDRVSTFLEQTNGAGAVGVNTSGQVLAVQRACTDPGHQTSPCSPPTAVAILAPERKVLANSFEGNDLGRVSDIVVDKQGGAYFTAGQLYHVSSQGKVTRLGENLRTNGLMLSPDEKTLYVTNGMVIVAFDVQPDGGVKNQRDFGKLEAGGAGDGMAVDAAGRLYIAAGPGVQVLSSTGQYLGVIPTPRNAISVAFSGADKKMLYIVGSGALGPDGKEFRTPDGVRNNAKSIFKIPMVAEGFKGRAK